MSENTGNIIGIDGTPATPANPQQQPQPAPRLNRNIVGKMHQAHARIVELGRTIVKTPGMEAEQRGLFEFLATNFITHGAEFIGCWATVMDEYDPLVKGAAAILARAQGLNAMAMKASRAQTITDAREGDNK